MTDLDMNLERRRAQQVAATALAGNAGRGILAVDFDDTLTVGDGTEGVAALVALRQAGWGLVVHTSNIDHDGIRAWLAARWPADVGPAPPVTDVKPQATAYIDDKAYRFQGWRLAVTDFGGAE